MLAALSQPTNGTGADASFTWCAKDKNGTTTPAANAAPYALWRYSGAACSGSGCKWVDNLTIGRVFTTSTAPASANLGTLGVDLPVDATPSDSRQRYELRTTSPSGHGAPGLVKVKFPAATVDRD